ncbi:MAG: DUF3566 domain-containing protein [Actinomycetota bacterium]
MADTQVTDGTPTGEAPARSTPGGVRGWARSVQVGRKKDGATGDVAAATRPATQVEGGARRPARTVLGRRRVRARRVRRTIRHIDPWSVFKVGIIFCLCLYAALLLSVSLLWRAADSAGLLDNIESFFVDIGLFDDFEFKGDVMFRAASIGGLVLAVASAAALVLMTVIFNLISDLMGGVRVSVIEEDAAYVRGGPPQQTNGERPAPPTL